MDKVSYSLGLSIGNNLMASGINKINFADFAKAVEDVMTQKQPEIGFEEAQNIINEFISKIQDERFKHNKEAGEKFLAENKNKPGVITLPSGLQYEVIKEGTGKLPKDTDQVTCHYEGSLIDGTVFDSSIQRGAPATFGVGQVIKGWVEALQLMPVGSKWKLYIPSELAYGSAGAGQAIEPNSTLIFEVEVLDIA